MPSITIRDVPAGTHAALAARAAASGKSMQEYLLAQLIELAERPDMSALIDRIRERKATTKSRLSAERILKHRDAGRR